MYDYKDLFITNANISGTDYGKFGSVLYNPGEIIGNYLNSRFSFFKPAALDGGESYRNRISGAGMNFATTAKTLGTTASWGLTLDHIWTSGTITASGGNVGSPYVVFIEAQSNQNQSNYVFSDMILIGF